MRVNIIEKTVSEGDERQMDVTIKCKKCKKRSTVGVYKNPILAICAACGENYFYIPESPALKKNVEQSQNKEELPEIK